LFYFVLSAEMLAMLAMQRPVLKIVVGQAYYQRIEYLKKYSISNNKICTLLDLQRSDQSMSV
jgi:hypothetical protein